TLQFSMSLSRRSFLRTAAASVSVGGITYFLPPFPKSRAADTTPPSERIRAAAIGVGNQGGPKNNLKFHAKTCVAVCDVDQKYLAAGAAFVEKECGKGAPSPPAITVGSSTARTWTRSSSPSPTTSTPCS